jgi:ABC-type sugar transport system ATPase subunit
MSTTAQTASWLVCRGVSKQYGGVQALSAVDLDLRPGEVHGLIGPNGAGKSTLAKIMAGAVQRDAGSVEVDGVETHFHDPAAAAGHGLVLMPQEIALVPAASVIDNVNLGAEPVRHGLRWDAECRREAAAALALLDLEIDPEAQAGSLSAAHQRMLMMARAAHRDARLLILDEPTAGLPPHEAELVGQAVRKLGGGELTIVYVSHHLSEVAELCDRVTCVRGGRIAATLEDSEVTKDRLVELIIGTPAEVASVPEQRETAVETEDRGGIELRDISGKRLRGVSLSAPVGQVTGVTGLLGSGVTELVECLVGAARPELGGVFLDGRLVSMSSPADALDHRIAYLAGDRTRAAFKSMSIRANVSVAALRDWFGRIGLLRAGVERDRAGVALAQLSVKGDDERPIAALSGGNQQRALVARLIAADARVLVLDEPTVGVDVGARAELWDAVRRLAPDRAIVVASSDPDELCALCDQVVCIRNGRIATVLERDMITDQEITAAIA